jgi:hypothetical protein
MDAMTTAATCVLSSFLEGFCRLTAGLVAGFTVSPVEVGVELGGSEDELADTPNILPATLLCVGVTALLT